MIVLNKIEIPYPKTPEEAMPDSGQIAEVKSELESAGVQYVLSCWIDMLGIPKTKPVMMSEFENLCRGKGPQFAVHSVSEVPELGAADADQVPIPDLSSVFICPWDRRIALIFADLFWEGAPYHACPRMALKRQMARAAEKGYYMPASFEPEFIVLKDKDGSATRAFGQEVNKLNQPKLQPFGYDLEHSLDSLPFLESVTKALDSLDWGLDDVVCEGSHSQFELDYHYSGPLEAADRLAFLRIMLKEIAKLHGMFVTYMPKPISGDWRSGAHVNFSLTPIDELDRNLFAGKDGGWSEEAFHAVAGQLHHGRAITALACPTVNSYKGLLARHSEADGGAVTWAPTHMCYGYNNRSAMIRFPQTRKAIENRAADMCLNPYLTLGMTMAASLEGIEQKLDPGQPINKALYDLTDEELDAAGAIPLPESLLEATQAFDEDPLAKEVCGEILHSMYSRYKHNEWQRFNQSVSDWEVIEYLRFF